MKPLLEIDEQSRADLGLMGDLRNSPLFKLFDHAYTRGGMQYLQQLFLNPLSSEEEIKIRIRMFSYLSAIDLDFPFPSHLFDTLERYMQHSQAQEQEREAIYLQDKEIEDGVFAMLHLLHKVESFFHSDAAMKAVGLEELVTSVLSILSLPSLQPILGVSNSKALSYSSIVAYDTLFRSIAWTEIRTLLQYLYRLDAYLAVGKIASKPGWTLPTVLPRATGVLRANGLYYPTIKGAVANSFEFSKEKRLLFLTGANMAGKSTFLRSLALALYIAHLGFPVPADSMEFSVLDGIFTTINLPDDLGMGASHFYVEVLRVKDVVESLRAGKSIFVIFDELFRGTNVKDAMEATIAVSRRFLQSENSHFVISSHIVEAADALREEGTIGFQFLPTKMEGHHPVYTYTLEDGVSDDRHGMLIIQNEQILSILEKGVTHEI
ncbi:MutS-related protein [Sphingobacterium faecale]|uniref:DNA mismatch repair protein n=1 Tax=Sphingobacterium faecale TaxID=2803775 RepID=A0ABS1R920_9SPHI|nr:DNA mismatch repair protein [Sphingobacterium faecale]MBL1411208.1 DNA mismatch repair protein [Sphingobacterium faecale]